ncbi:RidA family protein, partial [Parasphingorhabdus sp.]
MIDNIEKALIAKGIDLPKPAAPVASYVPAVEANGLLHISGQVSMHDGELITGRLGDNMSLEEGQQAAKA